MPDFYDKPKEGMRYWLTAVAGTPQESAHVRVARLLGRDHIFAFSERSPARKRIAKGDLLCFYAKSKGIVAHATVLSPPTKRSDKPLAVEPGLYPYIVDLGDISIYTDHAVELNDSTRDRLEALSGSIKDRWGWLVRSTLQISRHDFEILTRNLEGE